MHWGKARLPGSPLSLTTPMDSTVSTRALTPRLRAGLTSLNTSVRPQSAAKFSLLCPPNAAAPVHEYTLHGSGVARRAKGRDGPGRESGLGGKKHIVNSRCKCNVNNKFLERTDTRVSSALGCYLQYCANRNVL